jgi:hypothetical protein
MHSLKKLKRVKKNTTELDLFLTVGMEVFSNSHNKNKEIKNNNKNSKKEVDKDPYTEKIDALIAKYEIDKKQDKKSSESKKEIERENSFEKIKEISSIDKENNLRNADINIDKINKFESIIENKTENLNNKSKQDAEYKDKISKKTFRKNNDSVLKIPKIRFRRKKIKDEQKEIKVAEKKEINSFNKNILENNSSNEKPENKNLIEKIDNVKKIKNKQRDNVSGFNQQNKNENLLLDNDIKKVLEITDNLLGQLPEDVIDKFVNSKDFELYERIINKFKLK